MRKWALLGLGAVAACGGLEQAPADEEASDDWRAPAREQALALPPFPDLCSRYELEYGPHAPFEPVFPLSCPCSGTLYSLCDSSSCVTSLNCDAVCNSQGQPGPSVDECAGTCELGESNDVLKCVALPGGNRGTYRLGSWCTEDDQCGSNHCVAITNDGVRICSDGSQCNVDADCSQGARCALPDDSLAGFCGDGRDNSVCFSDHDCRASAHCVFGADPSWPAEQGHCSIGAVLARCATDDDCEAGLHCVAVGYDAVCSPGTNSTPCDDDSECVAGLHCSQQLCSDGEKWSGCDSDSECRSGRCAEGLCD